MLIEQTVLVVDDEPEIRRYIVRFLRENHPCYRVAEAADVPEARRKILELNPKLVIYDIHMPGEEGTQLSRFIQRLPRLGRTRTLAITGDAAPEVRDQAYRHGVCAFLPKPFRMSDLAASIGRLLH